MGDYVVVMAGDPNSLDEYRELDRARSVADLTNGYIIDLTTQKIIYDARPKREIPWDVEFSLSSISTVINDALDIMSFHKNDAELIQIKIAARKLDHLITKYCCKDGDNDEQ